MRINQIKLLNVLGIKKLDDIGRAFNFNTPLLPMSSETDGPTLPEGCDNVIEKLIFEAKSFYEGLRQEEPNLFNTEVSGRKNRIFSIRRYNGHHEYPIDRN